MRIAALVLTLVAFVVWSLWLVHDEGLIGLHTLVWEQDGGAQVFGDLSVALVVAWAFVSKEARARGVPVLPYIIATPFVGSPALLACLIHRELRARAS